MTGTARTDRGINDGTPGRKSGRIWSIPARYFRWVTAAGFLVATGLLVFVIGMAYQETRQQIRSSESVIHSRDVLSALSDYANAAKGAGNAATDYYTNGTETDVASYASAEASIHTTIDRLRFLTQDNPTQHKLTEDLNAQTNQALPYLREVMDLHRQGKKGPSGIEEVTKAVKPVSAALNKTYEELVRMENELLKDRSSAQSLASRRSVRLELWGGIFALLLMLSVLTVFLRESSVRLQAEEGLSLANAQLEQRVEDRVSEIERVNILLRKENTERIAADEALRQSEEKYRSIIENAVEGFVQTSPEGRYLNVNPAMARMFGYRSTEELLGAGKDIGKEVYVDPNRRAEFRRMIEEQGVVRDFEVKAYRKDGTEIWLSENARAVRDDRGTVLYYEGNVEDISARKLTDIKLQERTASLNALIENSPLAIVAHDTNGRVLMCNQSFEDLFLFSQIEIVGVHLDELITPPALRLEAGEFTQGVMAGETFHATTRRQRGDGTLVDVEIHGVALTVDGVVRGGYGLYQDVTQRKQAEEALRESEERYRMLYDNNPQPIWVFDLETLKFLAVNEAAVKHYGYSRDEFLAMTVLEIRPLEDRVAVLEGTPENGPGVRANGIRRHRKKDGTIIEVEIATQEFRFGARNARLALVRDVTERIKLENQLRQSQKMEAIGQLAGGVAHDFNNLLMVIQGHSEAILNRPHLDEPLSKSAKEIGKATERAAALTRQLLAFSRMQVLTPRVLDINSVLAEMGKMLPRLIREDIELRIVPDRSSVLVKSDPNQIEQVIMNLVVNARDAMPNGGKLTIEAASVVLDSAYAREHTGVRPGSYGMLAVSDTGMGMDTETQAHMFEPFFTTKEPGRGTGLGLATVYGIVKQSDGWIWVYSEVGKGTTFKIYLPQAGEAGQPLEPVKARLQPPRGIETILLVEDQEEIRELAGDVLKDRGYTVLEASDGRQALQLAERYAGTIDLLVTDIMMPKMGGRELAKCICASRPQLKAIYMSGYAEHGGAEAEILEENAVCLQKPFSMDVLLHKVREVLDAVSDLNAPTKVEKLRC